MSYSKRMVSVAPSKGVLYFQQFARNFVKPYDATDSAPSETTVFARLKPFNCEMLVRPKVGVSELAASVEGPLEAAKEALAKLGDLQGLEDNLSRVFAALEPLNKGSEGVGSSANVKDMLKFFLGCSEEVDEAVNDAFVLGSNLFTMAINVIVARTLFRNPAKYAEMVASGDVGERNFKVEGSVKGLRKFLEGSCVGVKASSTKGKAARKLLVEELESSEEEEEDEVVKVKRGKKTSAVHLVESSDEEEPLVEVKRRGQREVEVEVGEEVDEQEVQVKLQKKKKRKNTHEVDVEEEGEEEGAGEEVDEEEVQVKVQKKKKRKRRNEADVEEEEGGAEGRSNKEEEVMKAKKKKVVLGKQRQKKGKD